MEVEYDPEKLIIEIEKRPGIWDASCLDYRIKKKRYKLWAEVVKDMNPAITDVTKSELRQLEHELQKKWKGMRDCFIKYIQNPKRTKRPYIYAKQLQFLLKGGTEVVTRKIITPREESSDSEIDKTMAVWKRKSTLSILTDTNEISEEEEDEADNGMEDDNNDSYLHMPPIQEAKPMENEFIFPNIEQGTRDSDDPERLFLLSLLPHLKSIPNECRLNVKMELMQVLKDAEDKTRDKKYILG